MTNEEQIKTMSRYDLAHFLCDLMSADDCDNRCPASNYCSKGYNGMITWLEMETGYPDE